MPRQAVSWSYINHIEHLDEVKFSLIMVNPRPTTADEIAVFLRQVW